MSVTDSEDVLLTKAQAIKVAGISSKTWSELMAEGQGPFTLWRSDVERWALKVRGQKHGTNPWKPTARQVRRGRAKRAAERNGK